MTVSVVIATWNRADLLHDCLTAIDADRPDELIVVDNGSTDGTGDMIDACHPHVVYIRNDTNEGFAPASNRGAKEATGDVVIFLNNDTLPKPGWWRAMAAAVDANRPIVGCHLTYPDGRTQHAGIVITRPGGVLTGVNVTEPRPSRKVAAVTGACMAVDRARFLAAGGFHEGYRNGYEDVDLCLAMGGAWYCAKAEVVHLESQTPGRFDHVGHNVRLLQERWGLDLVMVAGDVWAARWVDGSSKLRAAAKAAQEVTDGDD